MNTHNLIINFGKHKGERWTRVPKNYLVWLVNQPEVVTGMENNKVIAQAELDRRGTVIDSEVEISSHAVDRASLKFRHIWHQTALKNEGIYTWLSRISNEVIKNTSTPFVQGRPDRGTYLGITFIFKWGKYYPILKTVI